MEFETQFTHEFVKRSLSERTKRILEVGCGSGALALALSKDGFIVVALDADAGSVTAAQKLGVDARVAAWPDFDQEPFDAVVFSRSLHHIHPLRKALNRAADCLPPGGRMIVEDFAHEAIDKKTLCWFAQRVDALKAAGLIERDSEHFNAIRAAAESVTAWRKNHPSDLHTSVNIYKQIECVFTAVNHEQVPYFFRYIGSAVSTDVDRHNILKEFAEEEGSLISEGAIIPLGRRFVAERAAGRK